MTWARGYDRSRSQFAVDDLSTGQRLPGLFTVVLNTGPYTYLGNRPLDLAPGARLQRGLTAVTFSSLRLPTLGAALMSAVRGRSVATVEMSPSGHLQITFTFLRPMMTSEFRSRSMVTTSETPRARH